MSESIRKTGARIAAREHRRRQREAKARLWKLFPFVVIGILVVLGVGMMSYSASARSDVTGANGPRLQVDREMVDLGDQHFGTTVHASFKITNTGDGTLALTVPKVATVVQGC